MRALFICDTHWLWYVAGRYGNHRGIPKPRVDYMALRSTVARALISRFGHVYDLECHAFVVDRRAGSMDRFIELIRGFGYQVEKCDDPTPSILETLNTRSWDLVVLASESVEALELLQSTRREGRKIVVATFDKLPEGADELIELGRGVLYEGR